MVEASDALGSQPETPGKTDGKGLYGVAASKGRSAQVVAGFLYGAVVNGVGVAFDEGGDCVCKWESHRGWSVALMGSMATLDSGEVWDDGCECEGGGSVEGPRE